MDYDQEKVDEAVLALLWLTTFRDGAVWRAWKGHDFEHLDRLHEKGYVQDPKSKAKSIVLTEEGRARSVELFRAWFGDEPRVHEAHEQQRPDRE